MGIIGSYVMWTLPLPAGDIKRNRALRESHAQEVPTDTSEPLADVNASSSPE